MRCNYSSRVICSAATEVKAWLSDYMPCKSGKCNYLYMPRGHFMYAPSQWETTLQCNVVSHWLGAYAEWSLQALRLDSMSFSKWFPWLVLWVCLYTMRPRQISQTTFLNAFSWMKIYEFRLIFHWSLFLWVKLTTFHYLGKWLASLSVKCQYLPRC